MTKPGIGLGGLKLFCVKCTREETIPAPTIGEAVEIAKLKGWVSDQRDQVTVFVCPKCPAIRRWAA